MSSTVPVPQASSRHSALRVLPGYTDIGPAKIRVTIEGEEIEEVLGNAAKRLALEAAKTAGCHKPGISSQSGAYPVDAEGRIVVTAVAAKLKFRNDFDVQGDL